jgi:hypothetical protein
VNRFPKQALGLIGVAAFLAAATNVAAAAPSSSTPIATGATGHVAIAASKKAKRKGKHQPKKGPAAGPSLSVIGFGVNRLYAPNGATVSSARMCDEIVGADSPVGPPQNVYLLVYVRANDIPADAPTRIAESFPGSDEEETVAQEPALSPPTAWSKVFAKGSFAFGGPEGSQSDLFHGLLVSTSAEEGSGEGPSAEEFNGTYSYTTSVEIGRQTLTSTAKVTVECPQLR